MKFTIRSCKVRMEEEVYRWPDAEQGLSEGMHLMVDHQMRTAVEFLTSRLQVPPPDAVHQSRKALARAVAALALVGQGEGAAADALRSARRNLSFLRDQDARLECLRRYFDREQLQQIQQHCFPPFFSNDGEISQLLTQVASQVDAVVVHIAPEISFESHVFPAVRKIYSRARKQLRLLLESEPPVAMPAWSIRMHSLRKKSKKLHFCLLLTASAMSAARRNRYRATFLAALVKDWKKLLDYLGNSQDIVVMLANPFLDSEWTTLVKTTLSEARRKLDSKGLHLAQVLLWQDEDNFVAMLRGFLTLDDDIHFPPLD